MRHDYALIEFRNWFLVHIAFVCGFMGLFYLLLGITEIPDEAVFRRYVLMASGSWGSWWFLGRARTPWMRRLSRFTVLVPGLAMLGMTAMAMMDGANPDRWNQWLLAGIACVAIGTMSGVMGRARLWVVSLAVIVAALSLTLFFDRWLLHHDPTLAYIWNAPTVSLLSSTLLPMLFAASRPSSGEPAPLGSAGGEVQRSETKR